MAWVESPPSMVDRTISHGVQAPLQTVTEAATEAMAVAEGQASVNRAVENIGVESSVVVEQAPVSVGEAGVGQCVVDWGEFFTAKDREGWVRSDGKS